MIELKIDENDITISKSVDDGVSVLIENSSDYLTVNMTNDEAKELIYALQEIIEQED